MSSKTKIVVLKSKELIYTGIFIVLGIMLILLLFYMFSPDKEKNANKGKSNNKISVTESEKQMNDNSDISINVENPSVESENISTEAITTEAVEETFSNYVPGVYTSQLNLGGSSLQLSVTVDENRVTGVSIDNMDETLTAMYPLVQPSIDEINSQIGLVSSVDDITYSSDNKYTTILILDAIDSALSDARK
ncbi:MAG: hypothetical protein E7263_02090 [Lachnospiraceae bacterium]|nr:hypothetical protein [Lachnospiraceae bacterium]